VCTRKHGLGHSRSCPIDAGVGLLRCVFWSMMFSALITGV